MKHILHLLAVLVLVCSMPFDIKAVSYKGGVYQIGGDTAVYLDEVSWVPSGRGDMPPPPPYGIYVCDTVIGKDTGKAYAVTAVAGRYYPRDAPKL